MTRKLLVIGYWLLVIAAGGYLLWPAPDFPPAPPDSIQSTEPADTESTYRRAYFTNMTREKLMEYYFNQFGGWGLRLVHPPEEAKTLIRDQTRSSWLEEIVHPGRESLYINAFVPTLPTDEININGVHFLNKVTVRSVPSTTIARLTVLLLTAAAIYGLSKEYA